MSPKFVTSRELQMPNQMSLCRPADSFSVTSMAFSEVSKSFIVPLKNGSSPAVSKQPPPTIWSSDLILGWDLQWREIETARTPATMPRQRRNTNGVWRRRRRLGRVHGCRPTRARARKGPRADREGGRGPWMKEARRWSWGPFHFARVLPSVES